MSTPAIVVEGLSKQYHIGARENQKNFREAIADALAAPFRRLRAFGRSSYREEDTIWALKDVSFEVQPGEVVGIIGRNGAGKSTLLRILTRITEPTEGRAFLNGRVGSLLEVGTGFHQELTGRENIYLSGAILGMGKQEIQRKFDEIVDFSGVEKFIDTPVKRYSSGMRVRLGFAVAAHLDPEILLIDEVLAVGDAEFQKKCLGKMESVAEGGRTVLFVSHNMGAVHSLCPRAIYIEDGRIRFDGDGTDAIRRYVGDGSARPSSPADRADRRGNGAARVIAIDIAGPNGEEQLTSGDAARVTVGVAGPLKELACTVTIYDMRGAPVASFQTANPSSADSVDRQLRSAFVCEIPQLLLLPGNYYANVALERKGQLADHLERATSFVVLPGMIGKRFYGKSDAYGRTAIPHSWRLPR